MKYNIIRTINGHDNGTILCTCNTKTEAQEKLQHYMSLLDNGGDDTYIGDEDARQNIIGMLNDIAEADGADVSADIAKVNSWSVPCIINQPTLQEVCNTNGDSFCYDSATYEIAEAKPTIATLDQLADYINEYAERDPEGGYDNATVEAAIEENGWAVTDNDYEVCRTQTQKVIINDNGDAEVIDIIRAHTDSECEEAIIQHLQSMCEQPTDIAIVSTEWVDDDAIFAVFTFGGQEQSAVYYPDDDLLLTPTDWQGRRPVHPEEIADYQWMTSAGDEAIVMHGLPRAFTAVRDEFRKDYGRKVRAAREAKGLMQEELARLSGLKQANISRIESGRYSITLDTMARLTAVLGDI